MKLLIVGAGGHGKDIAAIATAAGHEIVGWLDDEDKPGVIGRPSELGKSRLPYLLGVNDSRTRQKLDISTQAATAVHPSAQVDAIARVGAGVVIGALSCIGPAVALGTHTHINGQVFVTRADLGDYVTVGPGAKICGDVKIGDRVSIGAGAVISNLVTIEDDVVIGAGAVIPPGWHVDGPDTWVGVPARPRWYRSRLKARTA